MNHIPTTHQVLKSFCQIHYFYRPYSSPNHDHITPTDPFYKNSLGFFLKEKWCFLIAANNRRWFMVWFQLCFLNEHAQRLSWNVFLHLPRTTGHN